MHALLGDGPVLLLHPSTLCGLRIRAPAEAFSGPGAPAGGLQVRDESLEGGADHGLGCRGVLTQCARRHWASRRWALVASYRPGRRRQSGSTGTMRSYAEGGWAGRADGGTWEGSPRSS
ncbi:hypothetical protein GCM10018987_48320 [Streptomyces cremeus]